MPKDARKTTKGKPGGNQQVQAYPKRSTKKASWTILLDIAADGMLANFAVESLKQLKNSASVPLSRSDLSTVKVAAQFSVDAPAGQKIPRYIFEPGSTGSLKDCLAGRLNAPRTMTEQQALMDFLRWAFKQQRLVADHFVLILWGHGPELMMQPPPGPGHSNASLFLSPVDLRIALQLVLSESLPYKPSQFEVIGFDACSMSMFEVAYEIRKYAPYLVASQEEVPDLSFPYDKIVPLFRNATDLESMLRSGVYTYVQEYEDYINDAVTNARPVTLSALRLSKCDDLKEALRKLSCALYAASGKQSLPFLLIKAREDAREFVSGLYVDLFDFASALISAIDAGASKVESGSAGWKRPIRAACVEICVALKEDMGNNPKLLVLANRSADEACHGVSLYMPYISDEELAGITRPMVKGGDATLGAKGGDATLGAKGGDVTHGGKDIAAVLNDAAPQQLLCERRQLIADTEEYYEGLQLSQDTGWYRFIAEQWTPILVNIAKESVDILYSAEQAALNACRGPNNRVQIPRDLCPK